MHRIEASEQATYQPARSSAGERTLEFIHCRDSRIKSIKYVLQSGRARRMRSEAGSARAINFVKP